MSRGVRNADELGGYTFTTKEGFGLTNIPLPSSANQKV